MKLLVACEFSGVVRDAFLAEGHDAISCDLLPTESDGPHIQGDVRELLREPWDLVIAHPPCTRLCNSGVRWLHERNLWDDMREGAEFFLECLRANAPLVAVENPVMHKYAVEIIGRRQNFCVQPYEFGHGVSKRTCFWTKGLPKLQPTEIVEGRSKALSNMSASKDRGKLRSRFFPGMAKAMAEQWGNL